MPNNSKLQHSPTRNTLSCILTSQAECYTTSGSLPGPLGLSDHDLIFTVWKNENSRPKPCSWSARALAKKGGFVTTSCHKYHLIFWEKFRTEINCPSATSNILPLLLGKIISGNVTRFVVSDPKFVAVAFSDHFANIIHVEYGSDIDYSDHLSIKAISKRQFTGEFNYSPINTSCIRKILDHFNPRKTVGVDGISPRLLRLGSRQFSPKRWLNTAYWIAHCLLNGSKRASLQSLN